MASSTNGKFVNGGKYTVTELGDACVTLKDEITDNIFQASIESVSKSCTLAHAVVYPRVQGCTVNGTVVLHDLQSPFLLRNHLYVGLSRATDGSNVFISSE